MAIDPRFLNGVILKTGLIGAVFAAILGFAMSRDIGIGVAVGTLVSVLNLRFVVWALGKLLDAVGGVGGSQLVWAMLLGSKMLILMGIIWYLLSGLGIDPIGFTIGFSAFVPAILWQTAMGSRLKRG